jgi:hypothetical protein
MEEDQPIIIDIVIAKKSRMPNFYQDFGGPLRWQDDVTGELPAAVMAFFGHRQEITPDQLELVRQYCEYYMLAPCWDMNPHHDEETREELRQARKDIKNVKTREELNSWIHQCLEMGIDPL